MRRHYRMTCRGPIAISAFLFLPMLTLVSALPAEDTVVCSGIFGDQRFKHFRNETNTCYLVWNLKRDHEEARKQCEGWNSSLVVIDDDSELNFVDSIRKVNGPNSPDHIDYWIGLETRPIENGSGEMAWFWGDGTRYTGNRIVPGYDSNTHLCAMIIDNATFAWDMGCQQYSQMICEANLTTEAGIVQSPTGGVTTAGDSVVSSAAPLEDNNSVISGTILYVIIGLALLVVTVAACVLFIVLYMRHRRSVSIHRQLPGLKTENSTMTKASPINRKQKSQLNNNYYNVGPSLAGPVGGQSDTNRMSNEFSEENWSDGSGSEFTLTRQDRGPRDYVNVEFEGEKSDFDDSTLNVRDKKDGKGKGAYENLALSIDPKESSLNRSDPVQYSVPLAVDELDHPDVVAIFQHEAGDDQYALVSLRRKSDKKPTDSKKVKRASGSVPEKNGRASAYETTMVDNEMYIS